MKELILIALIGFFIVGCSTNKTSNQTMLDEQKSIFDNMANDGMQGCPVEPVLPTKFTQKQEC